MSQSYQFDFKDDEQHNQNAREIPSLKHKVKMLLIPLSHKDLVDFVTDLACRKREVYTALLERAGADPAFRKVFVHGLLPETTEHDLTAAFQVYGEIESTSLVMDRYQPDLNKGYGFVTFSSIDSAHRALETPKKWIGEKEVMCKLAATQNGMFSMMTLDEALVASLQQPTPNLLSVSAPQSNPGPTTTEFGNRKIFVRGLPPSTTEESFANFFTRFGEIEKASLAVDSTTGVGKGYGFVTFNHTESAEKAIAFSHLFANEHFGRVITVSWSDSRKTHSPHWRLREQASSSVEHSDEMKSEKTPSQVVGQTPPYTFLPYSSATHYSSQFPVLAPSYQQQAWLPEYGSYFPQYFIQYPYFAFDQASAKESDENT